MDFIFGNHKGEERFTFNIQVDCVQPWVQLKSKGRAEDKPAGLILKWNRDDKRSGTSKVAFLEPGDVSSDEEGAPAGAIHFNELFEIPATLHKEHKSPSRGGDGDGHNWQKKTIIFTLHDAGIDGQPKEPPLGRGVLDLAEFAAGGGDVMPVGKFLRVRLAVNKQIEKANGGQPIHIEATITCLSAKAKKAAFLEKSMSMRQEKPKAELKKAKSALGRPAAPPPEEVDQDLIDSLMESEGEESDGELSSQSGRQNGARNGQRKSRATAEGDDEELEEEDEKDGGKQRGSAADDADDDSDLDFMTEDDFDAVDATKPKTPPRSAAPSIALTPARSTPTKPASTPDRSTPVIPASIPDKSTSKAPAKSQPTVPSSTADVQKGAKASQEAKGPPEASARTVNSKSTVQQSTVLSHPDYGEGVSDGAVVSAAVGKAGMAMPQGKPIALKNKPGTENAKVGVCDVLS